jgi:hypothetical protein
VPRPLRRATPGAPRQPALVAYEGVQQAIERAHGLERLEAPREHRPSLRIGLAGHRARGQEPRAHRHTMAQGPAVGVVPAPPRQPLPHGLALDCAPGTWYAEPEASMRIVGLGPPVLLGEEGATPGAHVQPLMPVLRATRQPTPRHAPHQPEMMPRHLGEEPLAPGPRRRRRPTLALSLIHDDHAGCGPAPGDRIVTPGLLAGGGCTVCQHLLEG